MITLKKIDIFKSGCEAIVNPVNTVGIMGGGLAFQFKNKYSSNMLSSYKEFCKKNYEKYGILHVHIEDNMPICINFPTKTHFKYPSKLTYVDQGLFALKQFVYDFKVKSIAIPLLGCGLGGLDSQTVVDLIYTHMAHLSPKCDIDVVICADDKKLKINKLSDGNFQCI